MVESLFCLLTAPPTVAFLKGATTLGTKPYSLAVLTRASIVTPASA